MKKVLIGFIALSSFSSYTTSSFADVVKIDIKNLTQNSKCKEVERFEQRLQPHVKVLWKKCISGRTRIPGEYKKRIDYYHNPYFERNEIPNYIITEEVEHNGWSRAFIGDKVTEHGVYKLLRVNSDGKEEIFKTKPFGRVKTGGRIGLDYYSVQDAEYKVKGVGKSKELRSLIQFALNDLNE